MYINAGVLVFFLAFLGGQLESRSSSFPACEDQNRPRQGADRCTKSSATGPRASIESANELQTKLFEQTLKSQVDMQIELRLAEIDRMKACLSKNWTWFKTAGVAVDRADANCKTLIARSKRMIQENWSDMRTELALVKPRLRSDQLLPGKSTWYSSSPSHLYSDLASLPPLTEIERRIADEKYTEDFQRASLRYGSKDPSQNRNFTSSQAQVVRSQIEEARKLREKNYQGIIARNPVLGFISKENPTDSELMSAFEKMEDKVSNLKKTLKEQSSKRPPNFANYFQFSATVNSILKMNPQLCSAAESMKSQIDRQKTKETFIEIGLAIAAAVPCFFGGPLGWGICAAGGLSVGAYGVYQASAETDENLAQALTTQSIEDFSRLSDSERKLWAQKLLLPLALWGSGAGAAGATESIAGSAAAASGKAAADSAAIATAGRSVSEGATTLSSNPQSAATVMKEVEKGSKDIRDRRISPNRRVIDRIKEAENVKVEKLEVRDWAEGTAARSREDGEHSILYIDKTELGRNRLSSKLIHESVHLATQQAARKGTPAELDIWVTSSKSEIGPKGYEMGFGLDEARAHQVEAYVYRYNGSREESLKAKVGLKGAEDLARATAQRFTTTSRRFTAEALQQIQTGSFQVLTRGDRALIEWFSPSAQDKLTFHIRLPKGQTFTESELKEYVAAAVQRAQGRLRSIDESLNNRRP